jgi:hypothetical protein
LIKITPRPEDIPEAWLAKSESLTQDLIACEDDSEDVPTDKRRTALEKRRELIDKNASHWAALKEILLGWSHGKCWYSELRDAGSDLHVDHFRPKGRALDSTGAEREGYWWMAFEWRNYRIAVAWCNSPHRSVPGNSAQGKADHFPLMPGSVPAVACEDGSYEVPMLLDPMNADDVVLIDFDETGRPYSTSQGWSGARAEESIRLLHLDAPRMVEERQRIWRVCQRRLNNLSRAMNAPMDEYTVNHGLVMKEWIEEIMEMLRPDAELSAVARACLLASEHVWARKLALEVAGGVPSRAA